MRFNNFVAAVLLTTAMAVGPAMADAPKPQRLLTLLGHGEVKAVPDLAVINLGALTQATTAKAALDANTKNISALLAALKEAGTADKDMMTINFSVGPRYDNGSPKTGQPPKLIGYDVSNSVVVTVRKISDLGAILDKAVSVGSNQIDGISFAVDNSQAQQDEARKAAVKDALRKADLMAQAAGVKLGPIVNMSENGAMQPAPMAMRNRGMMSEAAAPVPIAQGEMTISSDVNIVWELE
jgi:uncharacterized protein